MSSSEFINMVYSYLDQEITVEDLEDWLIPQLPFLLSLPKSSLFDLVATIELGLAEMNSGALSEEAFRDMLKDSISKSGVTQFEYTTSAITSVSASYNLVHSVFSSDEISAQLLAL